MSQRKDTVLAVEDKPLLADVIVRNIANLSRLRLQMAQLEIETKPEDVLAEIHRLHDHVQQQQAGAKLGASRS